MNNNKLEITIIDDDGTTFSSSETFNSQDLLKENYQLRMQVMSFKLAIYSLSSVVAALAYLWITK